MWHTSMFHIAYYHRLIKSFNHYSMTFKSFMIYIYHHLSIWHTYKHEYVYAFIKTISNQYYNRHMKYYLVNNINIQYLCYHQNIMKNFIKSSL